MAMTNKFIGKCIKWNVDSFGTRYAAFSFSYKGKTHEIYYSNNEGDHKEFSFYFYTATLEAKKKLGYWV